MTVPVAARHASGDGPWFDLSQLTDECIGLNYVDHAAETGATPPAEPVLFMKAPDTVVGPQDGVLIPRRSVKTDYEVELAVVLGATARYLESPQQARAYVAGFAVSNDVSEREFQTERGGQWDKGKNCETFNPFGPWITTADEVGDPQDSRPPAVGQRGPPAGRQHQEHDLRRRLPGLVPQPVHDAVPG